MMKKICILVVAVCMVLSACSNKTNNVKFSEFNSEYVPVNEITDTYSKALKLEYAHFTIRDSVRIADVSSVSRTLYKPSDGFLFNKEQRFIDYLNGSPVDLSKISVSSDDMALPHLNDGKLEIRDNHLCLTRKGIFVSDGIMSDLMFIED